jgi:hypothetical protein
MIDRSDLILQCFGFLISDYGFQVDQKEFDASAMGNAYMVFISSKIGIEIVIDRNQVLIALGDRSKPRNKWFDFSHVLGYFSNSSEAAYLFPEKSPENTWDEIVLIQLNRLAHLLQHYCDRLLKGDLSMEGEIRVIEQNYVQKLLKQISQPPT